MILEFGIEGGPSIRLDDEMTHTRMTPEVAEDYMRRMREQVIDAYQVIAAYELVLQRDHLLDPEADDQR